MGVSVCLGKDREIYGTFATFLLFGLCTIAKNSFWGNK